MSKNRKRLSGGNWRQQSKGSTAPTQKYAQLAVLGFVIVALLAVFIWWILIPAGAKTVLHIVSVSDADDDVAEITFQMRDVDLLSGALTQTSRLPVEEESGFSSVTNGILRQEKEKRLNKRDTCLIYMSAHGVTKLDDDGESDPLIQPASKGRTIRIDSIVESIARVNATTKILLLDSGHLYQDPADGNLLNEFPYALDLALKKMDPVTNVWFITSNGLLERPLISVRRQQSVFAEAVTLALQHGEKGDEISIGDFYSSIVFYCRELGGTAQTPGLFQPGVGKIEDERAAYFQALAFHGEDSEEVEEPEEDEEEEEAEKGKKQQPDKEEPEEKDLRTPEKKNEEELLTVRDNLLLSGQMPLKELLATVWKYRDMVDSGMQTGNWRPSEFAPEFWHQQVNVPLARVSRRVLIETCGGPFLDEMGEIKIESDSSRDQAKDNARRELVAVMQRLDALSGGDQSDSFDPEVRTAIDQAVSNLNLLKNNDDTAEPTKTARSYFRKFRASEFDCCYYVAIYESLSWFGSNDLEEYRASLQNYIKTLEAPNAASARHATFDAKQHLLTQRTLRQWETTINELERAERVLRASLDSVIHEIVDRDSAQRECVLLEILASPLLKQEPGDKRDLLTLSRNDLISQLEEIPVEREHGTYRAGNWPKIKFETDRLARWSRAVERTDLQLKLVEHFLRSADSTAGSIQFDEVVNGDAVEPAGFAAFRERGAYLLEQLRSNDSQMSFYGSDFGVPLSLALAKFKEEQGLSRISFATPTTPETVQIVSSPREPVFVDRDGSEIKLKVRATGQDIQQVSLKLTFADNNPPFEFEHEQIIDWDKSNEELVFRIAAKRNASPRPNAVNTYKVRVEVNGTGKSDNTTLTVRLPFPDQIDLLVQQADVQELIESRPPDKNGRRVSLLQPLANRDNVFEFHALNRHHQSRGPIVLSLYAARHLASELMPGRIDEVHMLDTEKRIKSGRLAPIYRCKFDSLAAAADVEGKDKSQKQKAKLLSIAEYAAANAPAESEGGDASSDDVAAASGDALPQSEGALLCQMVDEVSGKILHASWIEFTTPLPDQYVEYEGVKRINNAYYLEVGTRNLHKFPVIKSVNVRWNLLDAKGKVFNSGVELLEADESKSIPINRGLEGEIKPGVQLLVDVDGWPRQSIFEYDGARFRERNSIRRVRTTKPRQPASGETPANNDAFIDLPGGNDLINYGVNVSKKRPPKLLVDVLADVSIEDHFGESSKSTVSLAINGAIRPDLKFRFPRRITNRFFVDPADSLLVVSPAIEDLTGIEIRIPPADNKLTLQPKLDLERDSADKSKVVTILFDKDPPRVEFKRIPKKLFQPGEKVTIELAALRDFASGVDPERALSVFYQTKRFGTDPSGAEKVVPNFESENMFTLTAPEDGKYYLALIATDRVGNSTDLISDADSMIMVVKTKEEEVVVEDEKSEGDEAKEEEMKEAKEDEPPVEVAHTLKVKVFVDGRPLDPGIDKDVEIKLEPEAAETAVAGNTYTFKGLKTGEKYAVSGKAVVGALKVEVKGKAAHTFKKPEQLSHGIRLNMAK